MTKSQSTNDQIKQLILETVEKQKPETAKRLIVLMQEHHAIPPEKTASQLLELENEDRLHFTRPEPSTHASEIEYIFSKQAVWYRVTIAIALATAIVVFTVPDTAYPIVYLRWGLGIIFLLFLPGFTFIKALFLAKVPVKTSSENMDTIERVTLSFVMSLALVPIVGLVLNFTPWGISLVPITLSLLALTVVFATVAIIREHQAKPNPAQA